MSPAAKKVIAVFLLILLAFPTSVCSLAFTPIGLASVFSSASMDRSIGEFALICSAVGWLICGLAIWGGVRLIRSANAASPRDNPTP